MSSGLTHVVDHIALVVDPAAYVLALTALQYGSPVNIDKFDKTYCLGISACFLASLLCFGSKVIDFPCLISAATVADGNKRTTRSSILEI